MAAMSSEEANGPRLTTDGSRRVASLAGQDSGEDINAGASASGTERLRVLEPGSRFFADRFRSGLLHELADGIEDGLDALIVSGESALDLGQLERELPLIGQHPAHLDEGAYHENADLDGPFRLEKGGRHDCSMFGKSKRQVFHMLPAL